jgi:hypothetical protein
MRDFPHDCAECLKELAYVYKKLAGFRDREENLNRARRAFKESAGIEYTSMVETTNYVQSVIVRYNLSEIYRRLAEVTHTAENLKLSLHACRDGLTFCI